MRSRMRTVFGAALLVVAFSASAQTGMNNVTSLSAAGGRYAFGQISSQRIDQYLLDTQTGRLWRAICVNGDPSACRGIALQPVPYADQAGNLTGLAPTPEPSRQNK